jgi:NAD(P)-dependent dehydrogenase (short-subunit alcohol dehydrogenase family)
MVTAGRPTYGRLLEMDLAQVRQVFEGHIGLALQVARHAAPKMNPGGDASLHGPHGPTPGRRRVGDRPGAQLRPSRPIAGLTVELAPVRANLIAPGFVDTALSALLLGAALERRRQQLRTTLPIRRVVGPADVAALAVHIMTNTALTGATYDIDGGEQFVAA